MQWLAPLLLKNTLEKLRTCDHLTGIDAFLKREITACERRRVDQGSRLQSLQDIHGLRATKRHNSMDGRGLKESARTPGQHGWVTDGTKFLTVRYFINSCRLRISVLPTKTRISRGRHHDRSCRAGFYGRERS